MQEIFSKTKFPTAPDGNNYHWEEADTVFEIADDGQYVIQIIASAKNAKQNQSTDDDDLKIAIDDYEFGKYEVHDEKISWKGFGTASSWDGASLKGGSKTIYFFLKLKKGKHKIKFYADKTPTLEEIRIFELKKGEQFQIKKSSAPQNIKVDKNGLPWISLIFLGVKPEKFLIASACKSAKQKGETDGDNLKVIVNGKILKNKKAITSDKYKNFYFSGDLNKGKSEFLEITPKNFEFIEDSVELWYDQNPNLFVSIEFFSSTKDWLKSGISEKAKLKFYESMLHATARFFSLTGSRYSGYFLQYALSDNSNRLNFNNNSSLVAEIKKDRTYKKILSIINDQIKNNILIGQIHLGNEKDGLNVAFENGDLSTALHGIKKIEYEASKKGSGEYDVIIKLFDVYDFDPQNYNIDYKWFFVYMADILENKKILQGFEIEINIQDIIHVENN